MKHELERLENRINLSYALLNSGNAPEHEAEHLLHLIIRYKIVAHRLGMRQGGVAC